MALTSDTQPSPKGVNCIEHESAEILNDADLEDGEIFEEEEPGENKSAPKIPQEKLKPPIQPAEVQPAPVAVKKPEEPPKNHKVFDNDKPPREQNVPFFNRGKRKHFDVEDDGRWKRDGKRNRRSHEFERDGELGRVRQDGELGEDDEEMMFVRGASPYRLDEEMDKWDREGEEDDRGDMPRRPRTYRGRGGGIRRGDRQRGRGRGGRGSLRGNKRKREDMEMCHFFLQGKCHRGSECPYAHEIRPPRKTELCKFYMKDCCAKKDKCLYMHSEFPCKYFHTGLKCYANKKCKFNHGPLTDQMNKILANHLDTAPKDILGEFPRRDRDRDMRDGRGDPRDMRHDSRDRDMRDMRDRDIRDGRDMRGDFLRGKNDRDRKIIPSLFDIKVSIPEDMRNIDGNHTPMPSPTQRSQDSTRSSDRDREINSPMKERDRERDKERDLEKHKHDKHEKSEKTKEERKEERKERKAKREKAREHRKERRERKEREKEKKREHSKDSISESNDQIEQQSIKVSEIMSPTQSDADNIRSSVEGPMVMPMEKLAEDSDKRGAVTEDNGLILQHLPKKQRELFLRIQQQQREAESSQASANDEDDEDDKMAEENWYSSDEETPSASTANPTTPNTAPTTSLPFILQGLTAGASSSNNTMTTTTTTSSGGGDPVMPLLNILASASAAAKPLDVPNPPVPTVPFIPPNLDFANLSQVFEALTSLQKMKSGNKQQTEQQQTATLTTTRSELSAEAPRLDEPSKPEPPRVRDPRLSRMDGGDVDLRLKTAVKPPQIQSPQHDVDLRSLPFKPVQHSAASEIDASLASHSPLTWNLVPVDIIRADYTNLQIQPRPGVNDPRLRRIARPPTDELGLPRDPRQRLMDEPPPIPAPVRDPRARGPLLATPPMPPSPLLGPPPTPRYDEDHRPQFYRMDSDMRQFPPPTPRMDEEIYTPGPSRPVDPRRKQFTPRPDDIDLRPMAQRVPFVNFK